MKSYNQTTSAALALALQLGGAVLAQPPDTESAPPDEASALRVDDSIHDEIVVTAQKREQTLREVPISISVLPPETLRELAIDDLESMQFQTPNLRVQRVRLSGNGTRYEIRGVGNQTRTDEINSSPVAAHVNEVAYPFPVAAPGLLFDIAQVEVLRGPQGDLFGLNTTGGTINLVTTKPGAQRTAGIYAELGNFETLRLDAYAGGPLSERLQVRVAAATVQRRRGWQRHEQTGQRHGEQDRGGARLSLRYVGRRVLADVEIHGAWDRSDSEIPRLLAPFTALSGRIPAVTGGDRNVRWSTEPGFSTTADRPFVDNDSLGLTSRVDWQRGAATLSWVSGYEDFEGRRWIDLDGSEAKIGDMVRTTAVRSWSQELRLAVGHTATDWMIGANVAADEVDNLFILDVPDTPVLPALSDNDLTQERDMWAIFGHVDHRLRARWTLSGGLRFTTETRALFNDGTALTADPLGVLTGIYRPGDILTDSIGACLTLGDCTPGVPFEAEIEDRDASGRWALAWAPAPSWNLYLSLARGFKSGGFTDATASVSEQLAPYAPERVWAFELGAKGALARGELLWDTALFYYDYQDQQFGDNIVDPFFGALLTTVNVPESELYGFETELRWQPTQSLTLRQTLGYTKGKFGPFLAIDGGSVQAQTADPDFQFFTPVFVDLTGTDLGTPELQYSGMLTWQTAMSRKRRLQATVDASYEGASSPIGEPTAAVPGSWQVGARLTLTLNERLDVGLWGRNLGDEVVFAYKGFFNLGLVALRGEPRTFGISLRSAF